MLRLYFRTTPWASDSPRLFFPNSEAWDRITCGSGGKPTADVRAVCERSEQRDHMQQPCGQQASLFPSWEGNQHNSFPQGRKTENVTGGKQANTDASCLYQWPTGSIVELKELKANLCHLYFCKSLSSHQEDTSCCVWHFLELFCLTSPCSHCTDEIQHPHREKEKLCKTQKPCSPFLPPSTGSGMGWRSKAAWETDRQTASSTHGHSTAVLSGQQALGQDPAASSHTHTAPEELRIAPGNSFPTGEWIANRRQHIKRFHPSLSFFSCRVLSIT